MITVLYKPDTRALFYSLYPIVTSKFRKNFQFTDDIIEALKNKRNSNSILLVRYFKGSYQNVDKNIETLSNLKNTFKKVAYFDDSDGADSMHFELLPYIDYYYKSQLLVDYSYFQKRMYGRQLFSNYYHEKLGINDEIENVRLPYKGNEEELRKIKLLWNLGARPYPIKTTKQRIQGKLPGFSSDPARYRIFYRERFKVKKSPMGKKEPFVQCRFSHKVYTHSIGYQRKKFGKIIKDKSKFLYGKVPKRQFYSELNKCSITLSPFGWGEICFRDFEALCYGSMLLKPDVDHLMTFPNIFIRHETYIPLKWDGSDLIPIAEEYLNDQKKANEIALNAIDQYTDEMKKIDTQISILVEDLD